MAKKKGLIWAIVAVVAVAAIFTGIYLANRPATQEGAKTGSVGIIETFSAAQEWWCFSKGGEDLSTGVDTTPIADGDTFEATLKTGW